MAKGDVVLNLEEALFVLQKKDWMTGEWVIQGKHTYRGRTDANKALQKTRDANPTEEWRSLLKQEAERYREGWKDCAEFIRVAHTLANLDEAPSNPSLVVGAGRDVGVPGNLGSSIKGREG